MFGGNLTAILVKDTGGSSAAVWAWLNVTTEQPLPVSILSGSLAKRNEIGCKLETNYSAGVALFTISTVRFFIFHFTSSQEFSSRFTKLFRLPSGTSFKLVVLKRVGHTTENLAINPNTVRSRSLTAHLLFNERYRWGWKVSEILHRTNPLRIQLSAERIIR